MDGPTSIQNCVPVSVELADKDEDADENVDADQTRTVRPVSGQPTGLFTQLEEIDIDFRVSGLPHAVVKEAEIFRVQELVKKTESHPHREALQADLQQNNVYNPFSNNSKEMIRELGNVVLFELCETIPKVQCSHCLLCGNQGIIYCTCGQFLVECESRRKLNKLRLDALSIPHYVIKKGRGHGARRGKTEEQKEYFIAFNAWKRCRKRVDVQEKYRESQLKIGWKEQKVHRDGQIGTRKSLLQSIQRGSPEISKTMVSHTEQIGSGCTDVTSIRLPSCSHNQEPSTPRIRRRTCRTHSFSTVSWMAPFFLE